MSVHHHRKLLVANRGEIAVRILRTAHQLSIPTVAIYTPSDAQAPHVLHASSAVALPGDDARGYLDAEAIVSICKAHNVTLVHPGYGFLSENPDFANMLDKAGITFLGPRPDCIRIMGLKHMARSLAEEVGVPLVPGSKGLLHDVETAVECAWDIGWPVMMKCTAGGGGMGLAICKTEHDMRDKFKPTRERALSMFHNDGIFLERYYPSARHIEIQVFGSGQGHAIHMGERECSVQRRHQKVIEEAPSPFMVRNPHIFEAMCNAAVRLCEHIKYSSAGTIEFLVDDISGDFFFLEMNTRLQVEHPVTEAIWPGLDIVKLMILQGIAERESPGEGLLLHDLDQARYVVPPQDRQIHAIEARIYCENPAAGFKPSPGLLQRVAFPSHDWLRVETWVDSGTTITQFFDPLVCKLIVTAPTRQKAICRLRVALSESKVQGPPNNAAYLRAICDSETFQAGKCTTTFLDNFTFIPNAIDVLNGGLETTVQDYPGRRIGLGMPRSGPMDSLAFCAANILVGNEPGMEGLEMTLMGCRLYFHTDVVVAFTGAAVPISFDGREVPMWQAISIPSRSKLVVGTVKERGFRVYMAVRGGFPEIPEYLGSKSTSMGLGGYQGRALTVGDHIALGNCASKPDERFVALPAPFVPTYPADQWTVYCLAGPHCDNGFITPPGIQRFFSTSWKISSSSNRMGIRLEGPQIEWARKSGGEGGSHPSNIHDNGYAFGTININGDTPVILTNEGPDMGGYVCVATVASAELWKLGQLRPGCTVQFKRISIEQAQELSDDCSRYLTDLTKIVSTSPMSHHYNKASFFPSRSFEDTPSDPKLHTIPAVAGTGRPQVVFRQAGDSAILVEMGELQLDLAIRARIHAYESKLKERNIQGIWSLAPCIRSTMVHFNPQLVSQSAILSILIESEASLPDSMAKMCFPGRKITFPIVLDDKWNREALERYMRSIRDEAVYLPSNIDYLARNNGLGSGAEALKLLVGSDWLIFGVGFYLACPFLVPIDPRCRLVGQKMNPSRTYTPRGAIGIAGLVAAIYPIESPGGYQLFGRSLPPWQTWGKGKDFDPQRPWLLQPFDQVSWEVVTEEEYVDIERRFDTGQYEFKIEPASFSMAEYTAFTETIADQIKKFKEIQAFGVEREEARERVLLQKWGSQRRLVSADTSPSNGIDAIVVEGSQTVVSSLSALVWKIHVSPGTVIHSGEDTLLILEAMKTEIRIEAGEENVGRTVKGFGNAVREGAAVQAGDVLVIFE